MLLCDSCLFGEFVNVCIVIAKGCYKDVLLHAPCSLFHTITVLCVTVPDCKIILKWLNVYCDNALYIFTFT